MAINTNAIVLAGHIQTVTSRIKVELDKISTQGEANVINSISLDGVTQSVTNKNVALDLSAYAKKNEITAAINYKGTVTNFSALPNNAATGDMYNIATAGGTDENGVGIKAGDNVIKTSTGWDNFGGTIDVSGKIDKVPTATSGNLATWGANGVLADSGKSFAATEDITEMLTTIFGQTT